MTTYRHEKSSQDGSKQEARQIILQAYRDLTGNSALAENHDYWTLCNRQEKDGSELAQLVAEGFLVEDQFHGVDTNAGLLAGNRADWPDAHWHLGRLVAVADREDFNPGVVYYDSVNMMDNPRLWADVFWLMRRCKGSTLFAVNAVTHMRGEPVDAQAAVVEAIESRATPEWSGRWDLVGGYEYRSNKATMATWLFFQKFGLTVHSKKGILK